jgi:hypothetical protein
MNGLVCPFENLAGFYPLFLAGFQNADYTNIALLYISKMRKKWIGKKTKSETLHFQKSGSFFTTQGG